MQVFEITLEDCEDIKSAGVGNVDVAFRKIQKNSTNFLIWRIENMNVVALPKEQYGQFYDADAYIIYAASQHRQHVGVDTVPKEAKGPLELHLHFWIGHLATPDKSGVAAYKTVELDNYLGGGATQHRESQGNEGPRFKSYFKHGMRVLKGGTKSGFQTVDTSIQPLLFKIKGKRTPVLTELTDISWTHFNSGDVFIVLTEKNIFVWIGRSANPVEKIHSTKIATQLKLENNIKNIIFVDDGYERGLHSDEKSDFEKYLPLDKRHVMPPESAGDDVETENQYRTNIKLYRCSDSSGKYRVTEVKGGPLQQSDLDSHDDVFILDHGILGIWVWVGKGASEKERFEAMRNARGFVKKKRYSNSARVTRVIDSAEPLEFKNLFLSWKNPGEQNGVGPIHAIGKIAKVAIAKFDATTMHERPALAAETRLIDDGSGTVKVWRVKKNELVEIPAERHGIFFSGDCYIIWYNYRTTSQKYIIYFWLGLHASQDESGVAALKTIEKDDELGGVAVQVRVVQGHEPAHFLQIFKGKMITFKGKGTDYDKSGANSTIPSDYLLQVQGTTTYSSKANEVPLMSSSLNSNHCFVLRKGKDFYIWCGNNSTGDQREMAKNFVRKDAEIVLEGKEMESFWNDIGGKSSYATAKFYSNDDETRPPRLFQLSTATGNFKSEEIFNFVQTDLIPEDVMILDAHDTIFIWIGNHSTAEERRLSMQTAKDYLRTDPAGRHANTPIVRIRQGHEPPTFTGFFAAWDNELWKKHKPFMDLRTEIEGSNASISNGTNSLLNEETHFDRYEKYPISVLKSPVEKLPNKIDPQRRELHLTHDDFVSLFKMTYDKFEKLPKWKQQEMKKKAEIF